MRYRIDFKKLEDTIDFIDDKNKLVKDSITNLLKYNNNLKWTSSNRELFDIKYKELIDSIKNLTDETTEIMSMLKKKYQLFDDVYNNKMKKISKDHKNIEKELE